LLRRRRASHSNIDKKDWTDVCLEPPRGELAYAVAVQGAHDLATIFYWSFHPFWHNWVEVRSLVLSNGFELVYENATVSWQVLVYKRVKRLSSFAEKGPLSQT